MRRPPVPDVWHSTRPEGLPQLTLGSVVDAPPGGRRVSVRLGNQTGRTVRNVFFPEGTSFQAGDRVLVARIDDAPHWVIVTRILDTPESGLYTSTVHGENELHPPDNFSVTGGLGMVLATWDAWPGNTVCWQVEHNSTANSTGSQTTYTRGSHFIYPTPTAARTRYVQVRAVRYSPRMQTAWHSRWTDWKSATSVINSGGSSGGTTAATALATPRWYVDGPLAVADEVGGVWILAAPFRVDQVHVYLWDNGTGGATIVDVERSTDEGQTWQTLFSAPGDRPEIAHDSGRVASSVPSFRGILPTGTLLRTNIAQVASGATSLTAQLFGVGGEELAHSLTTMGVA